MKKTFLLCTLLLFCFGYAYSQTTVTGVVTGAIDGKPLDFVSVVVKGTSVVTYTNNNGAYSVTLPEGSSTLVFTMVGMQTTEVEIGSRSIIDVALLEDSNALDEVIVTGFGTYKKSSYTGSASTVKTEALRDIPTTSINTMMQGNLSGVSVATGTSGQPGSTGTIRIRGVGSYNASNSPLYVIDGVPVMSGDVGAGLSTDGTETDIMSTISAADIENITVIKDAAAASLYGSRAANGVIVITTKSGKKGSAQFNFKMDFGFSDFATQFRPYLTGDERREFLYDAMLRYQKYTLGKDDATAKTYADANIEKVAPKPWSGWTDWDDLLFRKGKYSNYEFSASGATETFSYYTSLTHTIQEGLQKSQGLKTTTGRVNVKYNANKMVELGANLLFSGLSQDLGYDGMEYNAPLYASRHKVTASDAAYNQDGTFNRSLLSNGKYNPLAVILNDIANQEVTRSFNIIYGQLNILEGLKLRTTFNYDYTMAKANDWADPNGSSDNVTKGTAFRSYQDYIQQVWSTNLNYIKTFADKHNIDVLVAYEVTKFDRDYLSAEQSDFLNPAKHDIGNGSVMKSIGGNAAAYRMVSYISKANYDYAGKYYLGASFRRDGTSRLLRDNRWGNFWSVSGAWRFMREDFTQSFSNIITDGKIRASYGANGTQPSNYYAGMNLYSYGFDYNQQSGQLEGGASGSSSEATLVSEDLKWETNYNMDFGLDITFINRINMTLDVYSRKTKDLLFDAPVSYATGATGVLTNIGSFKNSGIELEIFSQNIATNDFSWNTSFNISHNKNTVVKLNGESDEIVSGRHIIKEGEQYYTYYLVEFAGIDPADGRPMFYDNVPQSDGTLSKNITYKYSEANKIMSKVATPNVFGGLTNTLRYKMFDFSFTFTFSLGGWSFDNAAQKSRTAGKGSAAAVNQIPEYYRNSWKQPGDNASIEAWIYNNPTGEMVNANTGLLHSTDHLRLKNFTFGVTIPKNWTEKIGVRRARVYASGVNMLTWAAFDQYDPEVPYNGIIAYNTPPLKTVTFGIEVGF